MNEGVQILIDRMKSNPEDFVDGEMNVKTAEYRRGKFRGIADVLKKRLSGEKPAWDMMNVLTTEEIEALTAAYVEMERKRFTGRILGKLLAEPEQSEEQYQGIYAQTISPAMTLSSSGNLGVNTTSGSNGTSALVVNNTATNKAAFTITTTGTPTMQLGAQKLAEHDITTLNEMIEAWRKHDD